MAAGGRVVDGVLEQRRLVDDGVDLAARSSAATAAGEIGIGDQQAELCGRRGTSSCRRSPHPAAPTLDLRQIVEAGDLRAERCWPTVSAVVISAGDDRHDQDADERPREREQAAAAAARDRVGLAGDRLERPQHAVRDAAHGRAGELAVRRLRRASSHTTMPTATSAATNTPNHSRNVDDASLPSTPASAPVDSVRVAIAQPVE